jgi:hypothetical protein
VGPMTVTMLLANTVASAERANSQRARSGEPVRDRLRSALT